MQDTPQQVTGERRAVWTFVRWVVVGIPGVLAFFVVSVFLPDAVKIPGVFAAALGLAAGWGLGRWGKAMNIRPSGAVAIAAWLTIAGGNVLSTVKTNNDRVAYLRTKPMYRDSSDDPIINELKHALATEPDDLSEEDRRQRQAVRDDLERGESRRRARLEHLTFYGFLQDRIPKAWGRWSYPWPAVFWAAEIVLGSTLGAWLTIGTLRNSSPRQSATTVQDVSQNDS
jgi:hypothetical protein